MGFGQAISAGFIKYFNFRDRSCRSEFWYWTLFTVIVGAVTAVIDAKLNTQLYSVLFQFATAIPSIAVTVRRLHDIDYSGWWFLISFVPFVGIVALIVFCATKGNTGPNRFGPDPFAADPFADPPPLERA